MNSFPINIYFDLQQTLVFVISMIDDAKSFEIDRMFLLLWDLSVQSGLYM